MTYEEKKQVECETKRSKIMTVCGMEVAWDQKTTRSKEMRVNNNMRRAKKRTTQQQKRVRSSVIDTKERQNDVINKIRWIFCIFSVVYMCRALPAKFYFVFFSLAIS